MPFDSFDQSYAVRDKLLFQRRIRNSPMTLLLPVNRSGFVRLMLKITRENYWNCTIEMYVCCSGRIRNRIEEFTCVPDACVS